MQKNQDVLGGYRMEFFTSPRIFRHPEPARYAGPIYPVFLPFSGCRQRCVFCAQHVQTGRPALDDTDNTNSPNSPGSLDSTGNADNTNSAARVRAVLREAHDALLQRRDRGAPPPEAAFYGGTFTAQPEPVLASCLEAASSWLREGLVSGLRCSTRPDAVDSSVLARLCGAGFSRVELGVQSFSDRALDRARRGYGRAAALEACALVQRAGLALGVQLMPGMPGHDRDEALADASLAASLRPDLVRLYPCLVLEGTALAGWWRRKDFTPWTLEETADFLARACLVFWRAGVPVARMGLAEEPGLAGNVLAGPRHPALGNMARARALHRLVAEEAAALDASAGSGPRGILVPRRYQGEFFGVGGELRPAYGALGIHPENVRFVDGDTFALGAVAQ